MLSRSSWRAARVLRAARGLESGPPVPTWPTNTKKKLILECTCSTRTQSRRSFSHSRRIDAQDEQFQVPPSSLKNVDVKGKGRRMEQYEAVSTIPSDHLANEHNEGTSYRKNGASRRLQDAYAAAEESSSSGSNQVSQLKADETEAALLRSLEDQPTEESLETSWRYFQRLPLDRRKELPLDTLVQITNAQKSLSLVRRGRLWFRLRCIYEVWQQSRVLSHGEASLSTDILDTSSTSNHDIQREVRQIPREELGDTLMMMREYFEQKEVVQEVISFAQARTLLCQIGEVLDPIHEAELLHQFSEIIHDYGSTENLVIVAQSLMNKLEAVYQSSTPDIEENEESSTPSISDIYSKTITRLAQRRETPLAIRLAARLKQCKIPFDAENCGREVVIAMLIQQLEEHPGSTWSQDTESYLELQRRIEQFGETSHFGRWKSMYDEACPSAQQAIENEQLQEEIDFVSVLGDDESNNALSLIKNRMRHLLVRPPYPPSAEPEVYEEIDALILKRGLEAVKLYEQYLARGFEADRELYRVAKMARLRIKTCSNFSKDLRAAAHMRAMEVRQREALNHKKKWYPPAEITGRWETLQEIEVDQEDVIEEISQDPPANRNIYADASLGQILHLAIETGDTELAKATFQAVKEDPEILWTLDDTERALSLLGVFIADTKRTDLSRTAMQDAVQLASSFYVRWQEDLARDTRLNYKPRSQAPARLRSPADELICIVAQHQQVSGYASALQHLLRDPSFTFSKLHARRLVKETLKQGALPWVALKLHIARKLFQSSHSAVMLIEELDHTFVNTQIKNIEFQDRIQIRWYEKVLEFMDHLDVQPSFDLLKRVLKVYEGEEEAERGSTEGYVVSQMRKEQIQPATLKESLLYFLRLSNKTSFAVDFLKLLQEGRILEAAPKMTDIVKQLLSGGGPQEARRILEVFELCAEDCEKEGHPDIVHAIHTVKTLIATPSKKKSSKVEYRRRVASMQSVQQNMPVPEKEAESPALSAESTMEASATAKLADTSPGFLSDFFSDTKKAKAEDKPEEQWQPNQYRESSSASNWQPAPQPNSNWQEATVGFQDAVGPENVQAAAATSTAPFEDTGTNDFSHARQQAYNTMSKATPQQPILASSAVPSQAYSTLASQPDFFVAHPPTPSTTSPSLLQELSQLPQQFADLTMDQFLALKQRYEIEMRAMKRRDEELLAARRMAFSRADASRWHAWQDVRATPWY